MGYAAGGEPVGQQLAGLIVSVPDSERPLVDLRIDMASRLPKDGGDAVKNLCRVFDAYKPLVPCYADFWLDNPHLSYKQWQRQAA